jgi:hypothetical protein
MDQATIGEANVNEDAEIDDVQHGARKLHAGGEVFELHDAATEDGRRQIVAGVDARASKRGQYVFEQMRADTEFSRELVDIDCRSSLGDDASRRRRWLWD